MSEKLAECPFCGKAGSIDEEHSKGNPEHVVFVPSCSDSDCIGVLIQSFARRSEAITAWNTRHSPTRCADLTEDEIDTLKTVLVYPKAALAHWSLQGDAEEMAAAKKDYDGLAALISRLTAKPEPQEGLCPVCSGDCASANPPILNCPMRKPRATAANWADRWRSDIGILLAAIAQMEEVNDEALDDEGGLVMAIHADHCALTAVATPAGIRDRRVR